MVNKMMLKMLADFMGTSAEEISQMMHDGHEAIGKALAFMAKLNADIAEIKAHLGIPETQVIEAPKKEPENVPGE